MFDRDLAEYATLTHIAGGYGYWVRVDNPATIRLRGAKIAPDAAVDLQAGWHLLSNWTRTCYYVTGNRIDPADIPAPAGVEFAGIGSIGDLFADRHYGRMSDLARSHGLGTHPESAGPFWLNIDALDDKPMS